MRALHRITMALFVACVALQVYSAIAGSAVVALIGAFLAALAFSIELTLANRAIAELKTRLRTEGAER